ncbi:MAG: DUF2358 domain-containing protein [Chroococcidiopsidaceae cyanobacterium CP_BM_RX_35]|nr:DUF2358 domain-containing protein [Chroococcidiopsidaceae cyanobacterium CP_BM_RX_35]
MRNQIRLFGGILRLQAEEDVKERYFDLHAVHQEVKDTILATWTVRGTLRVSWKAQIFFNGCSTYTLNSEGLIYNYIDTWDRKPTDILRQFFRKGKHDGGKEESS